MKKIISFVLVAVLLFSFVSCNNSDPKKNTTTTTEQSTVELNIEELKYNWTDGVLTFENGNQIKLPCTVEQIVEVSDLQIGNFDIVSNGGLEPGESKNIYLVKEDISISIECENLTTENVSLMEATVVEYSFNNTHSGNRSVNFANTLAMGVGRADVEEALGIPEGANSEKVLYTYEGRNEDGDKIKLRISFNSGNIVNSVAFEIEK